MFQRKIWKFANKKRGLKAYNSNWSHKNNADPM